jgi:drug/metabolite transporter (DMT)-like permease
MLTVGNGLVSWAEERVPSSLAALLVAAVPLYTALLDWARPGGRRPERPVLAGIVIGFAGMVLLALPDRATLASPAGAHASAGLIAILIAGLGWALGSLYARYGVRHSHTTMVSAQHMLAGGVALLVLGLARGEGARLSWAAITWASGLAFVYLTVFGSLLAFSAFGWLVVVSSPARLSTTAYVNPVVAVVLGSLLLHETLAARAWLGAALIVAAVMVMTLGRSSMALARGLWRPGKR